MQSFVFPGNIDKNISRIGSADIPYMRTDEFSAINLESERMLLELMHCRNGKTIIYTGSGTGAMSAVVENYVSTKKKALVINGGSFGARWAEICRYCSVPVAEFKLEFAHAPDYDELESFVAAEEPEVLLCQHHETSSGVLYDLKKISAICRRHGVSLVVDVISSFLAEELDMDRLGIDICVTSSQKGLNIPPGLSVVVLSAALEGYPFAHTGYYWDFQTNLDNLRRGQTPFSPATTLYLQLNARLKQLMAEGGEMKNIERVRHNAEVFRAECRKYSWAMPAESPSYAVTTVQTSDDGSRRIFRGLIERYDTFIMPCGKPGMYRISHMGLQSEEELRKLAARMHEIETEERV